MAFWVGFIVSLVVSLISAVLAKPKKRKNENEVQREGLDHDLERLYGTRRMSMVITNARTDHPEIGFRFHDSDRVGIGINWNVGERNVPAGTNGFGKGTRQGTRITMLHTQGPICAKGRLNAGFNKGKRKIDDFEVKVYDEAYTSSNLVSNSGTARSGTGWAIYLKGGVEDSVGKKFGLTAGSNDKWSEVIHAYGTAFQDLERGQVAFSSMPEFSFLLTSNHLFDPRGVSDEYNDPDTWTGRPDNPFLQLLDYLLDKEYGAGYPVKDINLESFKVASDVADLKVGKSETSNFNRSQGAGGGYGGFSGGRFYPNIPVIPGSTVARRSHEVVPFLNSNITLSTEDTMADNLGALLAACRGARLFKNKLGMWTVNPAFLLKDDMKFSFNGDGTVGPYPAVFFPEAGQQVIVKIDGVATSDYTFLQGGHLDKDSTGSTQINDFEKATYDISENKTVVYFNSAPPPIVQDARYATVMYNSNEPRIDTISFIPAMGSIVTNASDNTWIYTGPLARPLDGDGSNTRNGGFELWEIPGDTTDNSVGIEFTNPVSESSVVNLEYDGDDFKGLDIVARVVRDPNDLGLDYDADFDENGMPLIRIVGDISFSGVSIDDKYNQCVVKFPDKFLDYKQNQTQWPPEDSTEYNMFRAADNYKPLVNTVSVNHITSKSEALDYAEYVVRSSRSADQMQLKVDYTGIGLEPNDIIYINDPAVNSGNPNASNDYWKVVSTKIQSEGTVELSCIRYEGEDYAYFSKLLEDSQFKLQLLPIPKVTFPGVPVVPFENKSAGWGTLYWSSPAGLSSVYSYRVDVSSYPSYEAGLSYEFGDTVWYAPLETHLVCLAADPPDIAPDTITSDPNWNILSKDESDLLFETVQAITDTEYTIIPNVPETRNYVYRVRVIANQRGFGPAAYIAVDLDATLFGLDAILLLDSTKDVVIIPYESGIDAIDGISGGSYSQPLPRVDAPAEKEFDFTNSEYYLTMKKGDEFIPLSVDENGVYLDKSNPDFDSKVRPNSWYIRSITPNNVSMGTPAYEQFTSAEGNNLILVNDLDGMGKTALNGTLDIVSVYVTDSLTEIVVLKTIQYIPSSMGADGEDGDTVVQLSVYLDGPDDGTVPAEPVGGYFDFDQNLLVPPTDWYAVPPSVTEGVIWVSSQLYFKATPEISQPEPLGDWSSPTLYATFGGSYITAPLYTKIVDLDLASAQVPVEPVDDSVFYDFNSMKLIRPDDSPITLDDPFIVNEGTVDEVKWYPSVPEGEGNTWVTQSQFSVPGRTGIDTKSVWTEPTTLGTQGSKSIYNGYLLANIDNEQEITTKPPANVIGYNFNLESFVLTSDIDTPLDVYNDGTVDWYPSEFLPPLGEGEATWVIRETFTTIGAFGTDVESTWTEPSVFTGPSGADGLSSYMASAYVRTIDGKPPGDPSSGIPDPVGGSFNFDTGVLVPPNDSADPSDTRLWSSSIPEFTTGLDQIWVTSNLVTTQDPEADVAITDAWSTPVLMATMGVDGTSSEIIFKRSDVKPTQPADSGFVPNGDDGWYNSVDNVPPSDTLLLWASNGKKVSLAADWVWGEPYQIESGVVAEVTVYKRSADATVSKPSDTNTYDFQTHSFDVYPAGWASEPPNGLDPVWMSKGVASSPNLETTTAVTNWSEPTIVFRDGEDGLPGFNSRTVDLIANSILVTYDEEGLNPNPSDIELTATPRNTEGSVTYAFIKDGTLVQNGIENVYTYPSPLIDDLPDQIKVELYEDGVEVATDAVTIGALAPGKDGVKGGDGEDAISTFYSNQAHTVPVTNKGTEDWLGSGGELQLFEGTTPLLFGSVSDSNPVQAGTYNAKLTHVSGFNASSINIPSITGTGTSTATVANFSGKNSGNNLTSNNLFELSMKVLSTDGTTVYNPKFKITISPSKEGNDGSYVEIVWARSVDEPPPPSSEPNIPNGPVWFNDIPSGSNTLWACNGKKNPSVGLNWVWGTPYPAAGEAGDTAAEVTVYRRSTATPTSPVNGIYDFSLGKLIASPTNPSWYSSVDLVPSNLSGPLWSSKAAIVGKGQYNLTSGNWTGAGKVAEDGDSVTIENTTSIDGVTTVYFSDGTSIEINDGDPGTTEGVVVVYADSATGSNKSFTQGTREWVKYHEYTGDKPTLGEIPNSGFVKFTGDDGKDGQGGIVTVYSTVSNPSSTGQLSYTYSGQKYVTFYEYPDTKPPSPIDDMHKQVFVPFVGDDGQPGAPGQDGDPGKDGQNGTPGADGKRSINLTRYRNSANQNAPTDIAGNTYWDWDQNRLELSGGTAYNTWAAGATTPPTDGSTWQITATATQNDPADSRTVIAPSDWSAPARVSGDKGADGNAASQNPQPYVGVLTLYNNSPSSKPTASQIYTYRIGLTSQDAADRGFLSYLTSSTYAITTYAFASNTNDSQSYSWRYKGSGDWEQAEFIDTDVVRANAIQSTQLQISKESGSNRIFMDGDSNCIKIYSGGKLRIKLGNLA